MCFYFRYFHYKFQYSGASDYKMADRKRAQSSSNTVALYFSTLSNFAHYHCDKIFSFIVKSLLQYSLP